jgi:hypothetical protein
MLMGRVGLVCLVFGALACGSLEQHRVITGTPRAQQAGEVRVLMDSAPLPPGFAEVALVQAVGTGQQVGDAALLSGLKAQAQQLGCNAVVRVHIDHGQQKAAAIGVAGVLP